MSEPIRIQNYIQLDILLHLTFKEGSGGGGGGVKNIKRDTVEVILYCNLERVESCFDINLENVLCLLPSVTKYLASSNCLRKCSHVTLPAVDHVAVWWLST